MTSAETPAISLAPGSPSFHHGSRWSVLRTRVSIFNGAGPTTTPGRQRPGLEHSHGMIIKKLQSGEPGEGKPASLPSYPTNKTERTGRTHPPTVASWQRSRIHGFCPAWLMYAAVKFPTRGPEPWIQSGLADRTSYLRWRSAGLSPTGLVWMELAPAFLRWTAYIATTRL